MATKTLVITSGVLTDKRSFKWNIENIDVVRQSGAFIETQKFGFSAGEGIGLPTSWSCYLEQDSKDKSSIGLFIKLLEKPARAKEVNVSLGVTIKGPDDDDSGSESVHANAPFRNMVDEDDCKLGIQMMTSENEEEDAPLVEGSLVIDIDFTLYAPRLEPKVRVGASGKLETFKTKSLEQLSKDQSQIDTLASSSANFVTKIFSKDGIEFPANRGILSARSPVFQRMFATKMKEAITGEVRIEDISGKTLKVLLQYIYTGTLGQGWNSVDGLEELAYAARKYELALLTEFLDSELEEEGEVKRDGNGKKGLKIWQRIWRRKQK